MDKSIDIERIEKLEKLAKSVDNLFNQPMWTTRGVVHADYKAMKQLLNDFEALEKIQAG